MEVAPNLGRKERVMSKQRAIEEEEKQQEIVEMIGKHGIYYLFRVIEIGRGWENIKNGRPISYISARETESLMQLYANYQSQLARS